MRRVHGYGLCASPNFHFFPHFLLTFATTRGCVCAHARVFRAIRKGGLSGMMWHWFPEPCPSDPSDVGALIKVSLRACFYPEDLLSIWVRHLKSEELKSARARACLCAGWWWWGGDRVAQKERHTALLRVTAFLRSGEGGSWVPQQSFLSSQASGSPTCMFGQGVNNRSGIRLVQNSFQGNKLLRSQDMHIHSLAKAVGEQRTICLSVRGL